MRYVLEFEKKERELKEGLDYVKRGVKFLRKLRLMKDGNLKIFYENEKFKNDCFEIIKELEDLIYGNE